MGETVVERRLALEEVQYIGAVAGRFTADERQSVAAGNPRIRPYIAVGILVAFGLAATAEPGVLLAGMARNEVEDHMHTALMCGVEQCDEVFVGAVARRHLLVVAHVIAGVLERRFEARVQPDGVAAEILDIVQFRGDSGDVADAVSVGIGEGLRIDLVEHGIGEPRGSGVARGGNHEGVSPWYFAV